MLGEDEGGAPDTEARAELVPFPPLLPVAEKVVSTTLCVGKVDVDGVGGPSVTLCVLVELRDGRAETDLPFDEEGAPLRVEDEENEGEGDECGEKELLGLEEGNTETEAECVAELLPFSLLTVQVTVRLAAADWLLVTVHVKLAFPVPLTVELLVYSALPLGAFVAVPSVGVGERIAEGERDIAADDETDGLKLSHCVVEKIPLQVLLFRGETDEDAAAEAVKETRGVAEVDGETPPPLPPIEALALPVVLCDCEGATGDAVDRPSVPVDDTEVRGEAESDGSVGVGVEFPVGKGEKDRVGKEEKVALRCKDGEAEEVLLGATFEALGEPEIRPETELEGDGRLLAAPEEVNELFPLGRAERLAGDPERVAANIVKEASAGVAEA